jgi:hypothetical protein
VGSSKLAHAEDDALVLSEDVLSTVRVSHRRACATTRHPHTCHDTAPCCPRAQPPPKKKRLSRIFKGSTEASEFIDGELAEEAADGEDDGDGEVEEAPSHAPRKSARRK